MIVLKESIWKVEKGAKIGRRK